MTEPLNDNDPVNVNFPCTVQIQDPHHGLLSEEGKDDFFVCRKCNKVFNNLSQYVEHKVKEENFSLRQTRSKSDQRIVLPQLFEKRKKKVEPHIKDKKLKTGGESKTKALANDGQSQVNTHKGESCSETTTSGKKIENSLYVCMLCTKTFKREAALRWHLKWDHKRKNSGGDRPFSCDKCGRSFTESGSLTRHLKGRRNCAALSDRAYPRYKKTWNYHPNIPAVADPAQRDPQSGRSTLGAIQLSTPGIENGEEIQFIITELLEDGSTAVSDPKIISDSSEGGVCTSASATNPGAYTVTISSLENPLPTSDNVPKENENAEAFNSVVANVTQSTEAETSIDDQKETETLLSKGINDVAEENHNAVNPLPNQVEKIGTASLSLSAIAESNANGEHSDAEGESNRVVSSKAENSHPVNVSTVTSFDLVQSSTSLSVASTSSRSGDEAQMRPVVKLGDDDFLNVQMEDQSERLHSTQCLVCKKTFSAIEGLEIHLRTHLADEPSRCGLCHFTAQDREQLRHHILGMHYQSLNDIEASVLAMEVEEASLKKGETLQSRQLITRSALTAVKQLYSLKKLKKSPQQEKPGLSTTGSVQCMVCNKFFRGNSYLRQHMRTHTGDRPHQCLQCGRSFTSRDILKKHMYVHQERKDYKCGECGKLFKRFGHVQQHLRSHSQERNFRCSVCDKLFKTQHSLKVHMRTHSGINPYKCHICNNQFRERGSLQRHMRLHTGEKPFKCRLCGRAFSEQGTLSRHLKSKVPCSVDRDTANSNPQTSMLAQFSSVVAGSEQIFVPLDQAGQKFLVPGDQSSQQIILGGDSATLQHGLGQHQFFVAAGQEDQEFQVGSEYVVLQSGEEPSESPENAISVASVEAITDFDANFGHEQIPGTETLQVVDSTTGETVIIVAEKAIVDLVREKYCMLQSTEGGCSLAKIEQILLEAKEDLTKMSSAGQEHEPSDSEHAVIIKQECSEETVYQQLQPETVAQIQADDKQLKTEEISDTVR
ncbi:transcription factor E4F1-like [Elysia marginata]|uniref:Transcription factor E4F1-like n=1 Tax=Elysia marginata TaxID=1093978 RepID=A0AAV4FKV7_9GAST|nr:transcription factor E4F1-like [Elysia marginata]